MRYSMTKKILIFLLLGVCWSLKAPLVTKILLGQFDVSTQEVVLTRFNPDGTLDTTFNASGPVPGVVRTSVINSAPTVIVQPDERILITGTNTATTNYVMTRYNVDGTLDTSFGINGVLAVSAANLFFPTVVLQTIAE
jgi:uncharacterized delta-60 repeat protein